MTELHQLQRAPGPFNLITDVGGLMVGSAHDAAVGDRRHRDPAGCARAVAAVAVAGGGPGTRETDALAPDTLVDAVDAIVLSGGSVYGLAAADGVAAALGAAGQGFALCPDSRACRHRRSCRRRSSMISPMAGDKAWGETPPYRALGMQALQGCGARSTLGRAGAGFGARAGRRPGGLGSASVVTHDGVVVGALAAVNSHGAVRMPGTDAFWAWPYEQDGEFGGARPPAAITLDLDDWGAAKSNPGMTQPPCVIGRPHQHHARLCRDQRRADAGRSAARRQDGAGGNCARRPASLRAVRWRCRVLSVDSADRDSRPRPVLLARLGELAASSLARAIARGVYLAGR